MKLTPEQIEEMRGAHASRSRWLHRDEVNALCDMALEALRLRGALDGMLAIHDSVTSGMERELKEKNIPIARAALKGTP